MWLLDVAYRLVGLVRPLFGAAKMVRARRDSHYDPPYEDSAIAAPHYFGKLVVPTFDFRVILHRRAGCLSTDRLVPRIRVSTQRKKASGT